VRRSLALILCLVVPSLSPWDVVAQDATPPPIGQPSDPVACMVEPRAIPLYEALAYLPNGTATPDDGSERPASTVQTGPPADAGTVATVTATMRELTACQNAGDYRRQFALVTDDYLREFFAVVAEVANDVGMPPALAVLTFTSGSPRPRAEQVWITLESIADVRTLPDGRVSAVVVIRDPTREPEASSGFVVFEQVNGRWLVDGGLEVPEAAIVGALEP
jgi:hypothetical protein